MGSWDVSPSVAGSTPSRSREFVSNPAFSMIAGARRLWTLQRDFALHYHHLHRTGTPVPNTAGISSRCSFGERSSGFALQDQSMKVDLSVEVNGRRHSLSVATNRTVAEMLREDLSLTGCRGACDGERGGSCTVIIDGQPAAAGTAC